MNISYFVRRNVGNNGIGLIYFDIFEIYRNIVILGFSFCVV